MRLAYLPAGILLLLAIDAIDTRAADRKPAVSTDNFGNLTIEGTACAEGATLEALNEAKNAATAIVLDAAKQALLGNGLIPDTADAVLAGLRPDITRLDGDARRPCAAATLFVSRAAIVAGRDTRNSALENPSIVSSETSSEAELVSEREKADLAIRRFGDGSLAIVISISASLITLFSFLLGPTLRGYACGLIRWLREERER